MPKSFRGGALGVIVPLVVLGVLLAVVIRQVPKPAPQPSSAPTTVFVPSFERLLPAPGGHFELWTEHPDGSGERLAAFTTSVGGALLSIQGEPVQAFPVSELPDTGSTILLTVETGSDVAASRSGRVLLQGVLSTTDVTLEPVLPSLEGQHVAILASPTAPSAPDTAGIWFAKPTKVKGQPASGLTLPPLRGGWAYGGWVTTAVGTTLPTGLFTDPGKADQSAPFSGTSKGFQFPGEDFVRNPPEGVQFPLPLADGRTRVTVSLEPDFAPTSAEPFLPLLEARIPYQQKTGEPFVLEAVSAAMFPKGRGHFERRGP